MKHTSLTVAILGILTAILLLGTTARNAHATPSTELWTPAIMDVQPFGVWHLGIDNYFTVGQPLPNASAFPTDVGMTVGFLPFTKLNGEVGVDFLEPITTVCAPAQKTPGVFLTGNGSGLLNGKPVGTDCPTMADALSFNLKLGIPEGTFFSWQPGLNIGILDVGTVRNVTDMDILDLIVGKTIPVLGRIHAGGYLGNSGSALMHTAGVRSGSPAGGPTCAGVGLPTNCGSTQNSGVMVAFDRGFWNVKDKDGTEYSKYTLLADYASGKNYIGGGAIGLGINFTANIDVLTGPVWFNDHNINGAWKWTTQLDINF